MGRSRGITTRVLQIDVELARRGIQQLRSGFQQIQQNINQVSQATRQSAQAQEALTQATRQNTQAQAQNANELEQVERNAKRAANAQEQLRRQQEQFDATSRDVGLAGDVQSNLGAISGLASTAGAGSLGQSFAVTGELVVLIEELPRLKEALVGLPQTIGVAVKSLGVAGVAAGITLIAAIGAVAAASVVASRNLEKQRRALENTFAAQDNLIGILTDTNATSEDARKAIKQFNLEQQVLSEFAAQAEADLEASRQEFREAVDAVIDLAVATFELLNSFNPLSDIAINLGTNINVLRERFEFFDEAVQFVQDNFDQFIAQFVRFGDLITGGEFSEFLSAAETAGQEVGDVIPEGALDNFGQNLGDAFLGTIDPVFKATEERAFSLSDSLSQAEQSQALYQQAIDDGRFAANEAAQAAEELAASNNALVELERNTAEFLATASDADAVRDQISELETQRETIQAVIDDTRLSTEAQSEYRVQLADIDAQLAILNTTGQERIAVLEAEAAAQEASRAALDNAIADTERQIALQDDLQNATVSSAKSRIQALEREKATLELLIPSLERLAATDEEAAAKLEDARNRLTSTNQDLAAQVGQVLPAAIVRARQTLAQEIGKINADAAANIGRIQSELARNIAKINADAQKALRDAQQQAQQARAEASRSAQIELANVERELAKERIEIARRAGTQLQDAVAQRDVLAAFQARQQQQEDLRQAQNSAIEQRERIDNQLREQNRQIAQRLAEQTRVAVERQNEQLAAARQGAAQAIQVERQHAAQLIAEKQSQFAQEIQLQSRFRQQSLQIESQYVNGSISLLSRLVQQVNRFAGARSNVRNTINFNDNRGGLNRRQQNEAKNIVQGTINGLFRQATRGRS